MPGEIFYRGKSRKAYPLGIVLLMAVASLGGSGLDDFLEELRFSGKTVERAIRKLEDIRRTGDTCVFVLPAECMDSLSQFEWYSGKSEDAAFRVEGIGVTRDTLWDGAAPVVITLVGVSRGGFELPHTIHFTDKGEWPVETGESLVGILVKSQKAEHRPRYPKKNRYATQSVSSVRMVLPDSIETAESVALDEDSGTTEPPDRHGSRNTHMSKQAKVSGPGNSDGAPFSPSTPSVSLEGPEKRTRSTGLTWLNPPGVEGKCLRDSILAREDEYDENALGVIDEDIDPLRVDMGPEDDTVSLPFPIR